MSAKLLLRRQDDTQDKPNLLKRGKPDLLVWGIRHFGKQCIIRDDIGGRRYKK